MELEADKDPATPSTFTVAVMDKDGRYKTTSSGGSDDSPFEVNDGRKPTFSFSLNWGADESYDLSMDEEEEDDSASHTIMHKEEAINLTDCLSEFCKEEQLGESDPWYCSQCKEHRQATKKMDIWTLPEILVVHLKRFSYTRAYRDKINTLVDFPVDGLTFGKHCANPKFQNTVYDLYAVSNHMGGMGGGHYTAYGKNPDGNWYLFDDSRVDSVRQD